MGPPPGTVWQASARELAIPPPKYIKGVETAKTFAGLKEVTLEALMFQVADLAGIPRTLEVKELFDRLLEKGIVTAEEYNEVVRRLDH